MIAISPVVQFLQELIVDSLLKHASLQGCFLRVFFVKHNCSGNRTLRPNLEIQFGFNAS